jgi:hypothetical protein
MRANDDLRDLLRREPFDAFRIRLTSGDSYDVSDPALTVLMKTRLFVALPGSDRSVTIPYEHIAALETLTARSNGHSKRRRRR